MSIENIRPMLDLITFCEDRLNLETVEIGKSAQTDATLAAQLVGHNLSYRLILEDDIISLFACGSDQISEPRLLLRVEITSQNPRVIATLIKRLEESGFRDLNGSPIQLGDIGPHGIIIGD